MPTRTKNSFMEVQVKDFVKLKSLLLSKSSIVLIYYKECLHCKYFKPVWKSFTESTKSVQFFAIEYEVLQDLEKTDKQLFYYVTLTSPKNMDLYFPKLVVFKKGKSSVTRQEYKGEKNVATLTAYVNKNLLKLHESDKQEVSISFPRGGQSVEKRNLNEQIMGVSRKHLPSLVDKLIAKYLGL